MGTTTRVFLWIGFGVACLVALLLVGGWVSQSGRDATQNQAIGLTQTAVNQVSNDLVGVQTQVNGLNTTVGALATDVADQRAQLNTARAEVRLHDGRIAATETRLNGVDGRLNIMDGRINTLHTRVDGLRPPPTAGQVADQLRSDPGFVSLTTGPQGPTGPHGLQGSKGCPGPRGCPGLQGPRGCPGTDGVTTVVHCTHGHDCVCGCRRTVRVDSCGRVYGW